MQEAELGAALCALAGPRHGDTVAAVGAPPVAVRALLAATGTTTLVPRDARIAVAGSLPDDVRAAAAALAPGGRLVGTAEDARALVQGLGLELRHVEEVGEGIAWSAVRPARP